MTKRKIVGLILGAVIVLVFVVVILATIQKRGLYIPPYLQNVTQHSVVVMWETKRAVIGAVDYGESEKMNQSVSEFSPAKVHEVRITGLEPGKKYHYRVRYGNVRLNSSTFRTAPPDGTRSFRLVVYGDSRTNPKNHQKVVERIALENPDLIINTGDLVADGSNYKLWKPEFFMPLSIISGRVPVFTCLGNHERNSANYFNYMSLPGNEAFYSFDYANAHFISLDSNSGYTPYGETSPQFRWLIEDLEKHKSAEWIIVYLHHPLFRAYRTREIEPQRYVWHPVFEKYGVDLVLSGHDHHYARFYPIGRIGSGKGVCYITTGGGGAPLYDVTTDRNYIVTAKKVHNLVILDFNQNKVDIRAKDIDGNIIDSFTIDQTKAPLPNEYVSYEMFELERDLRSQMSKLPSVVVEPHVQEVNVDTTIAVRSSFGMRVEGEIVPVPSSGARWRFSQLPMSFALDPGAELRIPIKATATYPDIYPIPGLTLHIKKLGGQDNPGFRNLKLSFYPLKIKPQIIVNVPKISAGINIDGDVGEQAWLSALLLKDFVIDQASARPKADCLVKLAHDGTQIYVSAEIKAEKIKEIRNEEPVQRDSRSVVRGEHFRIDLSDGAVIYTFAVDPHGIQMDARNNDAVWNANWLSRVGVTENTWLVEMAIPSAILGGDLHKNRWFINIGRLDITNNEYSMLAPTFNLTNLENRLPEYSSSISDPEQLPVLTFR